jgi:NDP-sugar pyrophosphorylase family protein
MKAPNLRMSAILSGGVIAAGEGSRLKSLGVAKPMVPVAGEPLIVHVLRNFEAAGIASAAVIVNEAGQDAAALVRERFGRLVPTIVVKSTHSSLESFREILAAAPPGRLLVSTVDAFCPREEFVRFVRRAEEKPNGATVLAVTGYVHDEKPLWVTLAAGERRAGGMGGRSPAAPPEETLAAGERRAGGMGGGRSPAAPPENLARSGRVTVVGGSSGDAVTAGIYVFPERVRTLGVPAGLGRLRDFLAWLVKSGEPVEAIEIPKVVDVDRAEDLAEAEAMAAAGAARTP